MLTEREIRSLERRRDELTASIETKEARVAEIDAAFCVEGYYERTPSEEVAQSERERAELSESVERAMEEWSELEERIESLVREISGTV